MAGGTQIPVAIGRCGTHVILKPTGRCCLTICGDVRRGVMSLRSPVTTDIYFDLSEAAGIDSTFTGLLVSIAIRRKEPNLPAVHLLSPSRSVREALSSMHVLALLHTCTQAPAGPIEWQELPHTPEGPEPMRELIVGAHESLIQADPRNAAEFGPVVTGLRRHNQPQDSPAEP